MHDRSEKITAVVLSIIVLVGTTLSTVAATGTDMVRNPSLPNVTELHSDEVIELETLREANVKHFRLPDGSCEAVVYSHSVHRQDESGKWIDIDNSLVEETVDGVRQYSTLDARRTFAHNDANCPALVLTDDGYSVSMEFIGNVLSSATPSEGTRDNAKLSIANHTSSKEETLKFNSIDEARSIDNTSSIRYEDVRENTDIEYTLVGNDVKENIILYAVADFYSYHFHLNISGLLPALNEDGSISLSDKTNGEIKYTLPAPYMYDSLGAVSFAVKYALTERSPRSYLLTVCADEDWINASERVFPITIDPTIRGNEVVFDTYISSANKSTNYGASEEIWISPTRTAMLQIDPPYSIPEGSTIINATLNLPFYYHVTDGDLDIGAYEILYPWDEDEVTWNIANQNPNLGISTSLISTANLAAEDSNGVNDPGIATMNITSLMQGWIDGNSNYGIALKYLTGTNNSVIIRSWEINNAAESYYTVTYYPLIDIFLTTDRMGVDGTQQVNYSTYPAGLTPTWSSSNPSIATVNSSGIITAHREGGTYITASCYDNTSGNTYNDSCYLNVYDFAGIKDNASYYIMNYSSKRFLSLEDVSAAPFTNVFTRSRSATTLSQWTTKKQADGRYQFVSDHSADGRCLDVTNDNVDIYNDTGGQYLKFTVDRVEAGTYQGLYLIRYGNKYVTQDSNYNVYVTTVRNAASYWSFMAVEKEYADLFSFKYTGFDTTANNALFETVLSAKNYSAESDLVNEFPSLAYDFLTTYDDVFVFRGHGNAGILGFYDDDGVTTGGLSVNSAVCSRYGVGADRKYIDSIPNNGLSSLRVVLYLGCTTGGNIIVGGTTYNLVTATYKKGAHFVLGTTEAVSTIASNAFLKGFLDELDHSSSTVLTCVQQGLVSSSGYPITYVGDTTQSLFW